MGLFFDQEAPCYLDRLYRCKGESLSSQVFAEKALTGPGWKHIEVQVIGDGSGAVNHMWERECSIQRRYVMFLQQIYLKYVKFWVPGSRRSSKYVLHMSE